MPDFTGTDLSEILSGIDGTDRLTGMGGDDTINGFQQEDVAVYRGTFDEYQIDFLDNGNVRITDTVANRDGTDILTSVEYAEFTDQLVGLQPGQDVMFVIDQSGSMSDDIRAVLQNVEAVINAIFRPGNGLLDSRVGIVTYESDPDPVLSLTDQQNPEDRQTAFVSALSGVDTFGGTENVAEALLFALSGQAGTWRTDATARQIFLFTDEPGNDRGRLSEVYELAADVTEGAGGTPVPVTITTIALNSGLTRTILEQIADATGGDALTATDANDLIDVLLSSLAPATEGDDFLTGSVRDNLLEGFGGNDTLDARAGNDTLRGGDGDDSLTGGLDNDRLFGDAGADRIESGAGADYADGGAGNDLIDGHRDNDFLRGGGGADTLRGGLGDDTVLGGTGNDLVSGNQGNDWARGMEGDDNVRGWAGADSLEGGGGNDSLIGNQGNDTLLGGRGLDTLDGGVDDDFLAGHSEADLLRGNDGQDTLRGGQGDDTLGGGAGNDTIAGNEGHDTMTGGADNDYMLGADGDDLAAGNQGDDQVWGGMGRDTLTGGVGADTVGGGDGNDRVAGNEGADVLFGGTGDDTLVGGLGDDTMTGHAGADVFEFRSQNGADLITDFQTGTDVLNIASSLWNGTLDQARLDTLTDVTGGNLVFTFDNGDTLTLNGVTSTAGLLGDINLV